MTYLNDSNMVARHVRDGAAQNVPGAEACLAVNGWVEKSTGIGIGYVHAGPRFCHPAGNPHSKGHSYHFPVLFRISDSSPATHHDMFSCSTGMILCKRSCALRDRKCCTSPQVPYLACEGLQCFSYIFPSTICKQYTVYTVCILYWGGAVCVGSKMVPAMFADRWLSSALPLHSSIQQM